MTSSLFLVLVSFYLPRNTRLLWLISDLDKWQLLDLQNKRFSLQSYVVSMSIRTLDHQHVEFLVRLRSYIRSSRCFLLIPFSHWRIKTVESVNDSCKKVPSRTGFQNLVWTPRNSLCLVSWQTHEGQLVPVHSPHICECSCGNTPIAPTLRFKSITCNHLCFSHLARTRVVVVVSVVHIN